jgi:hypothetical protein
MMIFIVIIVPWTFWTLITNTCNKEFKQTINPVYQFLLSLIKYQMKQSFLEAAFIFSIHYVLLYPVTNGEIVIT